MAGSTRERAEKGDVVYKEFINDNKADYESDSFLPAPCADSSDGVGGDDPGMDAVDAPPRQPLAVTMRSARGHGGCRGRLGWQALGSVMRSGVSVAGNVEGRSGKVSGVCNRRANRQGPLRCGRK